jgi:hypothetical protein
LVLLTCFVDFFKFGKLSPSLDAEVDPVADVGDEGFCGSACFDDEGEDEAAVRLHRLKFMKKDERALCGLVFMLSMEASQADDMAAANALAFVSGGDTTLSLDEDFLLVVLAPLSAAFSGGSCGEDNLFAALRRGEGFLRSTSDNLPGWSLGELSVLLGRDLLGVDLHGDVNEEPAESIHSLPTILLYGSISFVI